MARVNANDGRPLMQEWLNFGSELLGEVFELRAEPRLHPLSGPDQLLSECGELRALAALGFDQGYTEKLRPLLDQVPDVTIGKVRIARGTGDLPGFTEFLENAQHDNNVLRAALFVESPDGFD